MSGGCSIPECSKSAVLLCYSCGENYCSEHSKLHDKLLHSALNPLKKEVKSLSDRYKKLNPTKLLNDSRVKLDQWKKDSYRRIDQLYEEKCQALKENWTPKVLQPEKDLEQIQLKVNQLMKKSRTTHEDIDQTEKSIRRIEKSVEDIEKKGIEIDIDGHSTIEKKKATPIEKENEVIENPKMVNVDILNLSSVYRTIDCSNQSGFGLTGNDQYLLIYENDKFLLFDADLIFLRECSWTNGNIFDFCYLSSLDQFLLVTDRRVIYLLDPQTMIFEHIERIPEEKWWSCTSTGESLFLSTYGTDINIHLFHLQSSFKPIKRWRSPQTCLQHEHIHQLNSSNEFLAIIISNPKEKSTRLEMRSTKTFERFWTFLLNIPQSLYQSTVRSCSLPSNQWILIIENNSNLFHIDQNGKVKSLCSYDQPVWNASLFAHTLLAIRTHQNIHFHQI